MNITIEDAKAYKENAIDVLRENMQYATATATAKAFDTLIAFIELGIKYGEKKEGAE